MATADPVKSVTKVLDLLEHLGNANKPLSVSEMARATGINVSTAHRLLQTLVSRGYVEQRVDSRTYALGPRVMELGSAYVTSSDLVGASLPWLEELRDKIGETIHLAVLSEGDTVELCNAGGQQPVSVAMRVGRRDPAHCTAIGKVLLASLSEAELDAFLTRGPLVRRTPNSITSQKRLLEELTIVRMRGYAVDDEELATGLCCVSLPIAGPSGRVAAAISVAMPKARYNLRQVPNWVKLLEEAAGRISAALALSNGR